MNLLTATTVRTVLCVFGGMTSLAYAQAPSSADVAVSQHDTFDPLLKELGSRSFIQRDWAARRLMRQGADVVPPLITAVRDTQHATTSKAAIGLLARMSRDADSGVATSALKGLTSLQNDPPELPATARQLIAKAFREAIQHNLAQLAAFGAEIERDDEQRITQISIRSERFTDRHMPLVCAFTSIRVLRLRDTAITGNSLRHLESLVNLDRLNLTDTRVAGADLRQLPLLQNLRHLTLYRVEVTADDINWLRENLPPQCKVYR